MSKQALSHRCLAQASPPKGGHKPARTGVVCPVGELSLTGALAARAAGLIEPVLIGPRAAIEAAAKAEELSLDGLEVVDRDDAHDAAATAAAMAGEGALDCLMKGRIHTDELMAAILARSANLRTGQRMSHVFALDVPAYHKGLFITDAALNIAPDLETKASIAQNAIDLARALGITRPKVAVMSASETVMPAMPSTLDAAALAKMSERGQIAGGVVDGPFAFDNAVSGTAAELKGIGGEVAGDADILLVPTIEAGNLLAKQLVYLAGAVIAGIVLGARVPVILTSRADSIEARVVSCAIAQAVAAARA